ncbi:hypothetical protein UPYG_G00046960 [Umbra pygmaea]|uniref:C-type lectin domain-containing protein n=1 Tax=Umbra pygmaea TaxID=75934 RepID=A0ABD0XR80_UMBPY
MQMELRRKAKLAKIDYKNKVEQKLISGNAKEAWQGLNIMMGRTPKPAGAACPDPTLAEKLNIFFTRFNEGSATPSWAPPTPSSNLQPLFINEQLVTSTLHRVNPHKASGPDRLRGRVLKECSTQLSGVLTRLFQHLLDSGCYIKSRGLFTHHSITCLKKSNCHSSTHLTDISVTNIMKVLIVFAFVCVSLFARAATVPVESESVTVEVLKIDPEADEAELHVPEEIGNETAQHRFCPDGWFSYQSNCYIFVNTVRNWFNAEKHCNDIGGSLASVISSSEYRYLQSLTTTANQPYAWIGGFYLQSNWLWIDRSGMYYTNWYIQSTPASNPCMYLQSAVGQGWRNAGCSSSYPSICVHLNRC